MCANMSDSDNLIVDTTTRIFQDLADPQTVNLAADDAWQGELWSSLEEMGLTRTWVPDDLGGAGATIVDAFEVLRVAGAFAVTVPLAETLIAGFALSRAGLETPLGPLSVVPAEAGVQIEANGTLTGTVHRVAFASRAEHLAVECENDGSVLVALVRRDACEVTPGLSLAKEPADSVCFDGATPIATGTLSPQAPHVYPVGAAVRAMQMAGALQAVLDISVNYATERVAFERPIGKFQAVQHNLARLAGEVAAANASANSVAFALENATTYDDGLFIEVASSKIRVGEAAHEGAMIGHQAHGAIGFTQEHILHRYTHRLWSWRDDFGDENYWATRLGSHFAAQGAERLWPTLTSI